VAPGARGAGAAGYKALNIVWSPAGPGGALAVAVAYFIDRLCGEPPARWHPVVWIGRALSNVGAPWPQASARDQFVRGAVVWLALAAASLTVGVGVDRSIAAIADAAPPMLEIIVRGLLLGTLLKPLLAWRMLREEVFAVEQALAGGVEAGRDRLRHIVGRDTRELSAKVVRESALESLAENLNDSFVAPLFWFCLGGLPGAVLYRFANTADAMWGLRGRWEWAGKWAALADDILSYVPARLTALLLAAASARWPRGLQQEARRTASPNGGWPMGMLALALDVRLSRPGYYVLHAAGRCAGPHDVPRGLKIAGRAAWSAVAVATLVQLA
jgi:adenosylcobinamide-phosphate synthase